MDGWTGTEWDPEDEAPKPERPVDEWRESPEIEAVLIRVAAQQITSGTGR